MSEFTFNNQVPLSTVDCDKLLALKSPVAVSLYLYMLRSGGNSPADTDCEKLGINKNDVSAGIKTLSLAGLLSRNEKEYKPLEVEVVPQYKASEIAGGISRDESFKYVVERVSFLLDKVLSTADLQAMYYIYDARGFTPGMILLLVNFCIEQQKSRLGNDAKKPSFNQINKEAGLWERKQISSETQAEQHIEYLEGLRKISTKIYRLVGVTGRNPSQTEEKYVQAWSSKGIDFLLIEKAYDITVTSINKFQWGYCDKILETWEKNGIHTISQVDEFQSKHQSKQQYQPKSAIIGPKISPPGQAELSALESMKRFREKQKAKANG